jgi:hypothetical protein
MRKVLQTVLVMMRFMNQGNYTHHRIGNVACGTDDFLLWEIKNASFDR